MAGGFTDTVPDLSLGQLVGYRNNPYCPSVPIDGRRVRVTKIMNFRSRTTGNQCVVVEGDCLVRDANELVAVYRTIRVD